MAITTVIEKIDPDTAEKYLAMNTTNRKIVDVVVAAYANDMSLGQWKDTHQGIAFNDRSELIDGQHRLAAVIKSGKTVEMLVSRGVPHENMSALDTGKKRSVADMLRIEGHSNFTIAAAVARLSLAYEIQNYSSRAVRSLSSSQVFSYASAHADEVDRASTQADFFHGKIPAPHSVLGTAWLVFSRIDPEQTAEFFNAMAYMRTDGENDPRLALFRRLTNIKGERTKANQFQILDMFVRAWNLWREKKAADKMPLMTTPTWRKAV